MAGTPSRAVGSIAAAIGFFLILAHGLFGVAPAHAVEGASAPTRETRVVLAILPFEVSEPERMTYLQEAAMDLLSSRLEQHGGIQVIQKFLVLEAVGDAAGKALAEQRVQGVGQQLQADYVVLGSITKAGSSYSLDVKVWSVATASTAGRVYSLARGDDAIVPRIQEVADKVASIVAAPPPSAPEPGKETLSFISEIQIQGADEGEEDEILLSLESHVGSTFSEPSLGEDIRRLLTRRNVRDVEVRVTDTPEGRVLTYRITTGKGPKASVSVPQAERVAEVRITGNSRIEEETIRSRIVMQPGDPYTREGLQDDVRNVHRLGYFRDVQVDVRGSEQGKTITFIVSENPIIRSINYAGNRHTKKDKLDEVLTIKPNETLDFKKLYENQQRLQSYYSQSGYYLASVKYSLLQVDENSVAVTFDVEEGNKLKLKSVEFVGNEKFSDRQLKGVMKTKTWDFISPIMSKINNRGIYREPIFYEDIQKVQEYYLDHGYLRAQVGEPDVTHDQKWLFVKVDITEGDPYKVVQVDVEGDEFLDKGAVRNDFQIKTGETFNRQLMTNDIDRLTERYSNRGFFYANVTPLTEVDDEKQSVEITYDVEKGNIVYFEDIDIVGNTKTRDPVIRRQVAVSEGELYNASAVEYSKNRVKATGFFEDVTVNTRVGSTQNQLDLTVGVKERPTGSFSFGAGFSSVDEFIFAAQIQQQNLFGRGQQLGLSGDFGGRRTDVTARWSDPYLFGSNWGGNVSAFADRRDFNDFERRAAGASANIGYPIFDNTRVFVGYSYQNLEVDQVGFDSTALLIREDLRGGATTGAFTPSIIRDTRNDRLEPTAGSLYSLGFEVAGGGLSDNEFTKVEARATWWWPFKLFPWDSVVALNVRAGGADPKNTLDDYGIVEPVTNLGTVGADGFEPPICCSGGREAVAVPGNVKMAVGDSSHPDTTFPLSVLDSDQLLPITERFFLGGLNSVRGFEARSLGPRRAIMQRVELEDVEGGIGAGAGSPIPNGTIQYIAFDSNGNGIVDFEESEVIGGNKYAVINFEYQFPISRKAGLGGLFFIDSGQAFAEGDSINPSDFRTGAGVGVRWRSPFGPLRFEWGVPLDKEEGEDSSVFEFSVGSPF
ncbi:MAG: outer membrane protein assembly factor BamA [Deltaproteobacteria bacterium]|nr:outer membrane protein assembly factor BamA [Deltaproteobacteria bacterium]